jgi:MFS transporter, PAT family, beta-lactamase induction signal transducer AmpG
MRRRPPPPWLFAFAAAPYGSFNGLVAVALPYVLRKHGIPVERIAAIGATVGTPAVWYFLWAPVVDVKLRRRTWVLVLSAASALCCALAIGSDASPSIRRLTALFVAASVFSQPVSSAIGGLVATVMPNELRGRTGGWTQAGIVGSGILAGGVTVWLTGHASSTVTAIVVACIIAVPAFAVLALRERRPETTTVRATIGGMARDLLRTVRRPEVQLGLLFFVSPMSAGALLNLFSAVAPDFHASTSSVLWVVAIAGVLTPVGALVGGILCDRMNRWRVYPIAGLAAAAAAAGTLVAPITPATYVVGAAAYALATGFGYAAFMALAFELTGTEPSASGTRFTLFMAASNAPVVYMLRLDGWGHAQFGVRGMLAVDALANVLFAVVFLSTRAGFSAGGSANSPRSRDARSTV